MFAYERAAVYMLISVRVRILMSVRVRRIMGAGVNANKCVV